MKVSSTFEDLDNYLNHHSVNMHAVDGAGIIKCANETELSTLGYSADQYVGKFIGDFHTDPAVVDTYPAKMKKSDGSTAFVMINSNVYKDKWGNFEHSRCFTTSIDEKTYNALKCKRDLGGLE